MIPGMIIFLGVKVFMLSVELVYQAYPRKVGRRRALLEIERAVRRLVAGESPLGKMTEQDAAEGLIRATTAYANARIDADPQYTPHPATWYCQARYLDDPKEWHHEPESKEAAITRRNRQIADQLGEKERLAYQSGDSLFKRPASRSYGTVDRNSRLLFGD